MSDQSRRLVCGLLIGVVCIAVVVYVIRVELKPYPLRHVDGAYDGCSDCTDLAKSLAWSLDDERDLWDQGNYTIVRRGGTCLWTANQESHVSGGTADPCEAWEPSGPDKALLWRAIQRWNAWNLGRSK